MCGNSLRTLRAACNRSVFCSRAGAVDHCPGAPALANSEGSEVGAAVSVRGEFPPSFCGGLGPGRAEGTADGMRCSCLTETLSPTTAWKSHPESEGKGVKSKTFPPARRGARYPQRWRLRGAAIQVLSGGWRSHPQHKLVQIPQSCQEAKWFPLFTAVAPLEMRNCLQVSGVFPQSLTAL